MTPKEAIKAIECNYPPEEYSRLREALDLAIDTLEKQIPMEPEFTDDYMDDAYCPNCENFEFELGASTWKLPYCPMCGQAIDWKEDNE